MVITCALGTTPEFPLFFGRGPLQSGVLQQLIQTEFTFPGEQKDWYPAEAIRQAAEDAQDLRYMIPVTQNKGYSAWYEPSFPLQHDSRLKTVAKPVQSPKQCWWLSHKPELGDDYQLCTAGGSWPPFLGIFFYLILVGTKKNTNLIHIMYSKMYFITRIFHVLEYIVWIATTGMQLVGKLRFDAECVWIKVSP